MAGEWRAEHAESPEVRTRRVLVLVFGFLGFTVLLFGALALYYRSVLADHTVEIGLRDFPAPRLQPNPNQDYVDFHAAQAEELLLGRAAPPEGPTAARAVLPITEAMARVVARGAQAYDPPEGTPPAGPPLADGAVQDGAPRATPSPAVAPYGQPR